MKTETSNDFKPTLKRATEIQEALKPLGYEVTGIQKTSSYSYLIYLSEIESIVRINPAAGTVENVGDILSVNNSNNAF